ncbi:hypothetical protein BDV96DRAFT_545384 [Lophiotrema nucula]|uniref:Uncharacterized protein n=1 Tax=Lophiotrema nucula TaxID=690887 RepID=A0A6A5ZAE8_9PLEO|nr:hypothetical protein BDV96DRAFT_545384 [Lophiotrema nucula]
MTARAFCQYYWLIFLIFHCFLVATVSAANNSSVADIWPDLANVPAEPKRDGVSYTSGGLLFAVCCNIALSEAVRMENGQLSFVPGQVFLHGDAQVFQNDQSPCTGTPRYTGYEASVQQGTISYSWCSKRCPGWDRIEVNDINAWVQQVLAYTLPAAIFCTNIPRRQQINVPRQYFPRLTFLSLLSLFYKVPIASLLCVVDTVLWLAIVFCLSGPMMLSGIYESLLDYKIIRQLSSTDNRSKVTFKQRCHLALILLIGNLDQDYAWGDSVSAVQTLPNVRTSTNHTDPTMGRKIRMQLQAQQSFGAVLGIGVLFFVTSFIYACLDLQGKTGVSIISHNLAFGIFWMVVPHVAIVANFTLTGSGSCVWDLVNLENMSKHYRIHAQFPKSKGVWQKLKGHFGLSPTDNSKTVYQTAWQWDRGHCKMEWLESYMREYPGLAVELSRKLHVSYAEWVCFIWLPVLAMLLVPCALGCLISATTPTVGISCKSIIPLIYVGAQVGLMILWQFGVSLTANSSGCYKWLSTLLRYLYIFLAFLGGLASIGGTIIVDTGMTNNCLCYLPMSQWLKRFDPSAVIFLGPDIDERAYYAHQFWLSCGIAAAAFLFAMLYFGWWFSRNLSTRFYAVCDQISGTILPKRS